jgi:hypothetical protein
MHDENRFSYGFEGERKQPPIDGWVEFYRPTPAYLLEGSIESYLDEPDTVTVSPEEEIKLLQNYDPSRLEICASCDSGRVYPLDFPLSSEGKYLITCRCPDCELQLECEVSPENAGRLDDATTDGILVLQETLAALDSDQYELDPVRFLADLLEARKNKPE